MLGNLIAAIVLLSVLVWFAVLIMSVVYHRYLTHRSIGINKWVARALAFVLQGMAFAPPRTWVASHHYHHAHTDRPTDPYSPKVHGFWRVFLSTPLLVVKWKRDVGPDVVARYARAMPDRDYYSVADRPLFCLADSMCGMAVFVLFFGWWGLALYVLQITGLYLVSGWVNSGAHTFGIRPYPNSGTNCSGLFSRLVNMWISGEWLHNHHHRVPGSANFGLHGELDTGYWFCRFLSALGLATIPRAQPSEGSSCSTARSGGRRPRSGSRPALRD